TRTKAFAFRAGPVIFVLAVVLWAGTNFPNYEEKDDAVKIETSYAGQLGKVMDPVFAPMGVDWRVGIGLISAFAAREVFVSSMAITFAATDDDEDTQQQGLLAKMAEATKSNGEKIFTVGSVLGLLVFFMIALQCMSTVGMAMKESGSTKFAIAQLVLFNVIAYLLAVGIYQASRYL
ncbi:MAG: nucleoside recognition domain-containing protein, partial [Bdellovibrionota bacterium]